MHLMVRAVGDPAALADPVRQVVRSLDAAQPIDDVVVMDEVVSRWLGDARFRTYLLAAFAVVALTLSALGLYAVMSYLVQLRRPEIGVRIALGASRLRDSESGPASRVRPGGGGSGRGRGCRYSSQSPPRRPPVPNES